MNDTWLKFITFEIFPLNNKYIVYYKYHVVLLLYAMSVIDMTHPDVCHISICLHHV